MNNSTLHAYQTLDRDSADIYLQGGCLFGFRRSNTPHHHLTHTLSTAPPESEIQSKLVKCSENKIHKAPSCRHFLRNGVSMIVPVAPAEFGGGRLWKRFEAHRDLPVVL